MRRTQPTNLDKIFSTLSMYICFDGYLVGNNLIYYQDKALWLFFALYKVSIFSIVVVVVVVYHVNLS